MGKSTLSFEDLPCEEQISVKQLKERMVDSMKPDMYDDLSLFVRFLRARDLNINAAEVMLKNHLDWRKLYEADTIATDFTPKEVIKRYITVNSLGIDKEGSPILYTHLGRIDPKGLLKSAKKIDAIKYIIQILEENVALMEAQSQKNGKHIDKWTMIFNCEELSLAVVTHEETLDFMACLFKMYEANYPERLKVAFVINASFLFTMAFTVLKVFLSEKTHRKIKVFAKEGWQEKLLKAVDASVLPAFLGGSRTDPDGNPLCLTVVTPGGQVDERYFISRRASLSTFPGVDKLVIARKSKFELTYDVTVPGSFIKWEFELKKFEIEFSLLYKEDNETWYSELIPKQKIDTNWFSEAGMYKCDKLGTYVIEFDNSYSWFHQKEIYYKITVE